MIIIETINQIRQVIARTRADGQKWKIIFLHVLNLKILESDFGLGFIWDWHNQEHDGDDDDGRPERSRPDQAPV